MARSLNAFSRVCDGVQGDGSCDSSADRLVGFSRLTAVSGASNEVISFDPDIAPRRRDNGEAIRRFGAKPCKNFVDDQAASPSSWKTPRMAVWMAA